jgi:Delta7-sterol 5-desaturase
VEFLSEYFSLLPAVIGRIFLRYLLPAGLAYFILWILLRAKLNKRRTGKRAPRPGQMLSEFTQSIVSICIFACISVLIHMSKVNGLTKIYDQVSDYGFVYLVFSIIAVILLHDTYFYWTHRLSHHRAVYRILHSVHHQSINTTPWTSHYFGIIETIVQGMFMLILVFVMPLHLYAIIFFVVHGTLYDTFIHTGYEILPERVKNSFFFRHWVTSTHHSIHHQKPHYNFSFYFRFWDKLMKTEDPHYEKRFTELTETDEDLGEVTKVFPLALIRKDFLNS